MEIGVRKRRHIFGSLFAHAIAHGSADTTLPRKNAKDAFCAQPKACLSVPPVFPYVLNIFEQANTVSDIKVYCFPLIPCITGTTDLGNLLGLHSQG